MTSLYSTGQTKHKPGLFNGHLLKPSGTIERLKQPGTSGTIKRLKQPGTSGTIKRPKQPGTSGTIKRLKQPGTIKLQKWSAAGNQPRSRRHASYRGTILYKTPDLHRVAPQ